MQRYAMPYMQLAGKADLARVEAVEALVDGAMNDFTAVKAKQVSNMVLGRTMQAGYWHMISRHNLHGRLVAAHAD